MTVPEDSAGRRDRGLIMRAPAEIFAGQGLPGAGAARAAHGRDTSASENDLARDPLAIVNAIAPALRAIDPPLDAWAKPTAGPDPRPVYSRPTYGHPPRSATDPIEGRALGPAAQVPAAIGLLDAGQRRSPPSGTRCISPPRPDGHTRARVAADPAGFSPFFAALIEELREPRTLEQERAERSAGLLVRYLPTPSWEQWTTPFEVKVAGTRRQAITFYCHDRVFIFLNADTGECRVDFKAKELWAHSWAEVAGRWLSDLSELLFDHPCQLRETYRQGWRMTGIELCADFVDFPLLPEDVAHFVGGLENSAYVLRDTVIEDGVEVQSEGVNTINLGRRSGNVSFCIYDKTTQLEEVKGGDNACYRSSWIAGGYDGESPITRVELRLTRHGLQLAAEHTDANGSPHLKLLCDFRDPATLADPKKIGIVWAHCAARHRLVVAERTRLRRDAIDPRWLVVLAAGGDDPPALRQFRQVNRDTWENKVKGAVRRLVRSAIHLGALHGVRADRPREMLEITRFAHALALSYGDDLPAYSDAYYALATPFVGPEIWSLGKAQWLEYSAATGVVLPWRTFSVWTRTGALDRALSATGPPGLQPREENNDG